MQNEITELRNQVRTLKRIVCLVCCLFVFWMIGGCHNNYNKLTGEWETSPGMKSMDAY